MKKLKVSLICPVKNEEKNISALIESMISQSRLPDEIIFSDSFSTDKTPEIIKEYSKRYPIIKLFQKKTTVGGGRNDAIKNSKYPIIAATDAGSRLDKDWLKNIIQPFEEEDDVDVVSGGYITQKREGIQDYISMVTIKPMEEWDEKTFLPSGRSIAFKKDVWEKVGGYPEGLNTGEDTLFDLKLKKEGFKFKLQKKAIVYWGARENIKKFIKQFYLYGMGDSKMGNLKEMKLNAIFFVLTNVWLLFLIISLMINLKLSLFLILPPIIYLLYKGFKQFINSKKIGCLIWIPILIFLKRISYFFGVWGGLIKK